MIAADATEMGATRDDRVGISEGKLVIAALGRNRPAVAIAIGLRQPWAITEFIQAGWRAAIVEPDRNTFRKLKAAPALSGDKIDLVRAAADSAKLQAILNARGVSTVDLLRIDVEDVKAVIEALNPEPTRTRGILARFDDCANLTFGYDAIDVADALVRRGYQVLVSEWWQSADRANPAWRGLRRYPCDITAGVAGWLIGLEAPPAADMVRKWRAGASERGESENSPARLRFLGEFSRGAAGSLEEMHAVSAIFGDRQGTLIDVGAHRGSTLTPFAEKNWKIVAFEPDDRNRAMLEQVISSRGHAITVDRRAIDQATGRKLDFYYLPESSGASSLHAFAADHRLGQQVETVTLDDAIAEHGIESIDVLKLDIEGNELFALQGFSFEPRPRVLVVEYDDGKTVPLGYTISDIAQLLRSRGYEVFVSEWHPILRYGAQHAWRRFYPWGHHDVPPTSWGNLIALDKAMKSDIAGAVFGALRFASKGRQPATPKAVQRVFAFNLPRTLRWFRLRCCFTADDWTGASEAVLFAAPPIRVIRSGPNSIELMVAGTTDHHFTIETGGKKRNKLVIVRNRGGCLAKVNGCSVAIMGSLPRLSLKSLAVGGLSTDSPSWQGEILNFSVAAVGKRVANRSIKRESALTRIAARLGLGGSR